MKQPVKIIISASRRTDIPAFYMDWFMEQIHKGCFEVVNPYNGVTKNLPACPDNVDTIVFWSKNFGYFIKKGFDKILRKKGYNLFFNFTINSESPVLEPNTPPLKERFEQLEYLSSNFPKKSINWRFDPVCFYKIKEQKNNNLKDFSLIAEKAYKCGIQRCITSFMDYYPKIKRRIASIKGFTFIDPPIEKKVEILLRMERELEKKETSLYTCCENEIMENLPSDSNILKSSCIPNDLISELYGGNISLKKDRGQRITSGCGCRISVDIGSYRQHPCYNRCVFCYANP